MIGNVVAAHPTAWHPGLRGTVQQVATAAPGLAVSAVASAGLLTAPLNVILPGVGVVIGAIIGSLFAAHAKRVAGAKQENQVLSSLIPTVMDAISAVFDHANAGQISATDAVSGLEQIQQSYWQAVQQVEGGPGQAGGPGKCASLSDTTNPVTKCDRSCTASCCIGCDVINKWIYRATRWFQAGHDIVGQSHGSGGAGGSTGGWDGIVGNKYGLQSYNPPNWTYTPPPPGSVAAAVSSGAGVLSSSVLGIPLWMIAAGLLAWKVM
jgi:hypothetical protein